MADDQGAGSAGDTPDASTVALFQSAWRTYRKIVENNYLFHREAYSALHRFLVEDVDRPFHFLDLACGDASASARALQGTKIVHYHGIDFSAEALKLAGVTLAGLGCPVTLEERDFVAAIGDLQRPVDVAWIGLSLHHLRQPEKRVFMARMRSLLGDYGRLLIYEPASPDDEDRARWLKRWDALEPTYTACTKEEWDSVSAHVHAADFPEMDSTWRRLGRETGFGTMCELFRAPTDLLRLYCLMP